MPKPPRTLVRGMQLDLPATNGHMPACSGPTLAGFEDVDDVAFYFGQENKSVK